MIAKSLRPLETRHVARTYAGILALVGMQVVFCRAIKNGAGFEGTVLQALATMVFLGAVGFVLGTIAQLTVDDAVKIRLQSELDVLAQAEEGQQSS